MRHPRVSDEAPRWLPYTPEQLSTQPRIQRPPIIIGATPRISKAHASFALPSRTSVPSLQHRTAGCRSQAGRSRQTWLFSVSPGALARLSISNSSEPLSRAISPSRILSEGMVEGMVEGIVPLTTCRHGQRNARPKPFSNPNASLVIVERPHSSIWNRHIAHISESRCGAPICGRNQSWATHPRSMVFLHLSDWTFTHFPKAARCGRRRWFRPVPFQAVASIPSAPLDRREECGAGGACRAFMCPGYLAVSTPRSGRSCPPQCGRQAQARW